MGAFICEIFNLCKQKIFNDIYVPVQNRYIFFILKYVSTKFVSFDCQIKDEVIVICTSIVGNKVVFLVIVVIVDYCLIKYWYTLHLTLPTNYFKYSLTST